ncbi:MAG: hypothetical protein H5T86_09155 [Armatimonadetes bacterium]|nr:hypothetical protein [Armatimonadota bacterium]
MGILAGYSEADITPGLGVALDGYASRDRGADEIADPLLVQGLYLSDGSLEAVVISADVCSLPGQTLNEIRQAVSGTTGVRPAAVVVCPSHTHFAPAVEAKLWMRKEATSCLDAGFGARLVEQAAAAARQAKQRASAARLRAGKAQAPGISFNRRPLAPDGRCTNRLRLPPEQAGAASFVGWQLRQLWDAGGYGGPRYSKPHAHVEGLRLGVTDPDVTVLAVETADGRPMVAVVNFACHPVCGGPNFYAVSADYVCYMRRTVRAALMQVSPSSPAEPGLPAVMFVLGAAGDQVPAWREDDARARVGQGLGGAALLAWNCAQPVGEETLRIGTAEAELPLREFPAPAELRERYESADATQRAFLGFQLSMAERIGGRKAAPLQVTALRVGSWGLVNGAGEILTEIGLHIKQRSPVPLTMFASLSVEGYGYMPTDEAMREGGYEAEWSGLAFGAAAAQIETALTALCRTL